jgi:hypothetical protein
VAPAGIHDVFVGRQPIFDDQERLYSYELLYRAGAASDAADGMSRDQMCRDTVLHTLLSIGLAPLTGGTLAFVNLTRQFLMARLYELFDPKTVVIELLETVEPDDEVVAECERLVSMGYTLALDDFVNAPGYEPLLRWRRWSRSTCSTSRRPSCAARSRSSSRTACGCSPSGSRRPRCATSAGRSATRCSRATSTAGRRWCRTASWGSSRWPWCG